jgi:hypothetical protein
VAWALTRRHEAAALAARVRARARVSAYVCAGRLCVRMCPRVVCGVAHVGTVRRAHEAIGRVHEEVIDEQLPPFLPTPTPAARRFDACPPHQPGTALRGDDTRLSGMDPRSWHQTVARTLTEMMAGGLMMYGGSVGGRPEPSSDEASPYTLGGHARTRPPALRPRLRHWSECPPAQPYCASTSAGSVSTASCHGGRTVTRDSAK